MFFFSSLEIISKNNNTEHSPLILPRHFYKKKQTQKSSPADEPQVHLCVQREAIAAVIASASAELQI